MFKLENIKNLKSTLLASLLVGTVALAGTNTSVDGAIDYSSKDGSKYGPYHINNQKVKSYNIGRTPSKKEVKVWNIDVASDGKSLPKYDMKHGKPVLERTL